ncbi:MAG TPA: hypothetical protein VEF89_09095 [Solirubrobacteraceae bacterium]|nr:hypothetical protein [Solirubrobacteraceae bacterium]
MLLVAGLALTGCATSASAPTSTQTAAPKPAKVSAAVRAQELAIHAQVMASLHAPAPKDLKPGIPSFIPRGTIAVNRIVTATPSHPQLAIQGDSVVLDLTSGDTLATMNGPLYNNKYVGTNDPTIPAQFLLTFTQTHGTIPLAPDDFTILDQLGNNIVPQIRVKGGGPLPTRLDSGQRLTLIMSTIISAGDGSIVYNPTGITQAGHKPLVGWDFIVEDD